jgi:putative SOS response-associated peptidase YedK
MCGRFGLANPGRLKAAGALDAVLPDALGYGVRALLTPRYNVAPTQPVVAARTLRRDGGTERRLDVFRWGLIPSWARDPKIGNSLANARAETLHEKPSFRGAWKAAQRCLVFADAFYEWQDVGDPAADPRNGDAPGAHSGTTGRRPVARAPKPAKQPYAIRMRDDAPFAFAGLWEAWRDPARAPDAAEAWVPTCTLITTAPNTLMARIHDRMPVIVPPEAYGRWLDPALPLDEARALLAPYAPEAMRAYPVSRYVNSPAHDDPHVLDPLPPEAGAPSA